MKITSQATKKLSSVFILLVLASSLILVKGCGGAQSAPDGSTVNIEPSDGYTASYPDTRCFPFFVTVRDPNGDLIPFVDVNVWSAFAIHSVYSPTLVYQLYDSEFCAAGTEMDNYHTDRTEADGKYVFSALVTTGTPVFEDAMRASAGTATTSVPFVLE